MGAEAPSHCSGNDALHAAAAKSPSHNKIVQLRATGLYHKLRAWPWPFAACETAQQASKSRRAAIIAATLHVNMHGCRADTRHTRRTSLNAQLHPSCGSTHHSAGCAARAALLVPNSLQLSSPQAAAASPATRLTPAASRRPTHTPTPYTTATHDLLTHCTCISL